MVVIYIRHADDEDGDKTYPHDPGISPGTEWSIDYLVDRLVKRHGNPKIILTSPMARTIETLSHIRHRIPKTEMRVDPNLSRYFSSKEMSRLTDWSLNPRTVELKVPLNESRDDFNARVEEHVDYMTKYYRQQEPVIWCLTHAAVMRKIAAEIGLKDKGRLDFLETLCVVPKQTGWDEDW